MKNYILPKHFILIVMIIGLLLAACKETPKTYTIGVINSSPNLGIVVEGFKEGMTTLGYVEGKNITYIYDGPVSADKLDTLAQDLVKAKVDLIMSMGTPATKAAQKATTGAAIPVLFVPMTNPVESGVVKSLTQPGDNITGVTYSLQEGKRLEWLLQVVPTIKQIYIVYNPKDQSPISALKTVSETAAKLGVELITREASTPEEIEAAFKNIPEEADAIFFLPDTVVNMRVVEWFKIANQLKLPTSGPNTATLNDGALTAYGIDLASTAKQEGARLADQILQGVKPADLPVEMANFYSAINLKIAQTIGLDISDETLRQADNIIR